MRSSGELRACIDAGLLDEEEEIQQQQAAAVGEMEAGRRLSRFPRLERAEVGGRYHPEDLDPTIDVDDEVCAN